MKSPLIAVYDKKIGLFDPPFTCRHVGEALREFSQLSKDTNTKFGKNPEDYDLFQLGTYDDATGLVEHVQPFVHLSNGVQ